MSDKFKEFLIITEELNKKNIIPLLMGSLGLEFVTEKDWNARDIDIHVSGDPRGWEAPDEERVYQWDDIIEVMLKLNYKLVDLHEHEFLKNNISVEYSVVDTLPSFANVTPDELSYQNIDNIEFYTPTLEAFLKIYLSSSEDGYRNDNNNNKDFEKISYLKNQLT